MTTIEVFDPPMCCSTGVCGPSVDPALATFAADLDSIADQGVRVARHNLSQEPKAFADSDLVRGLLAESGNEALPAIVVDGMLRSSGRYPSRTELATWALGARGSGNPAPSDEPVSVAAAGDASVPGACCGGGTEAVESTSVGAAAGGTVSGCCG